MAASQSIQQDPSKSSGKDQSSVSAASTNAQPTNGVSVVANSTQPPRRYRYSRSSTTSVTQLLSDSCNSILQKFRRNPSERPEKKSSSSNRFVLSPSKSASIICEKDQNSDTSEQVSVNESLESSMSRRYGATDLTSGYGSYKLDTKSTASSTFDRLRNNLSPVSSYYKPLMRTFGKRDDSPKRKDATDKDKTPVPSEDKPMSTISRLESKYSDVLDRFARRRGAGGAAKRQEIDRDKTLEPDRNGIDSVLSKSKNTSTGLNPLMRSATAGHILSMKSTDTGSSSSYKSATTKARERDRDRKERTPYRLNKNKTRPLELVETGYDGNSTKPRSELGLLNNNSNISRYRQKLNDYDPSSNRYKDNIYDALTSSSRLPLNASDYGYYDAARMGKENIYKSKYDPGMLYAEVNNNVDVSSVQNGGRSGAGTSNKPRRQFKSYRHRNNELSDSDRRHTTNYNHILDSDIDTRSFQPSSGSGNLLRNRKSYGRGVQRSNTQHFHETEGMDEENDRSSADVAAIVAALEEDNNHAGARAFKEQVAKRKEIKKLMMKYALPDENGNHDDIGPDHHSQVSSSGSNAQRNGVVDRNAAHLKANALATIGHHNRYYNDMLSNSNSLAAIGRNNLLAGTSGYGTSNSTAAGLLGTSGSSSRLAYNHHSNKFLPLSKTSSTSSILSRSRIPKTFVRIDTVLCLH